MSASPPQNRRIPGAKPLLQGAPRESVAGAKPTPKRAIEAPPDPLFEGDDSPLPGPATTTVRPPPGGRKALRKTRPFLHALKLISGVIIVFSASIAVAWGARRYVTNSPRFAIRTILVEGEKKRSAGQIASAAGVALGNNVFVLDLVLAGQMLTQDPWIERATVTRKLPSTIAIRVVEREASALASIGGELFLATRDGDLFKKLGEDDPSDLPLVTGVTAEQVARDRPGVVLAIKKALDVAEDMDRAGIGKRYPLQEIHLEKDGSVVVILGKEAIFLHLGSPPYREKIEQAARVLVEVARRKANASVIFLDNDAHPERVVVRMR